MSWRDDFYDDEAEAEMEQARQADRQRARAPVSAATVFRVGGAPSIARCERCGFETDGPGFLVGPDGRRLCAWRFTEKGVRIDCYDSADRQNAERLGGQVDRVREIVRDVKETDVLGDHDKQYLLSVGLAETVNALEKRIRERKEGSGPKGRGRRHEP